MQVNDCCRRFAAIIFAATIFVSIPIGVAVGSVIASDLEIDEGVGLDRAATSGADDRFSSDRVRRVRGGRVGGVPDRVEKLGIVGGSIAVLLIALGGYFARSGRQ